MLDGSLVTRLLSIVSLSISPECLATVTVISTPFFKRICEGGREGGEGGREGWRQGV